MIFQFDGNQATNIRDQEGGGMTRRHSNRSRRMHDHNLYVETTLESDVEQKNREQQEDPRQNREEKGDLKDQRNEPLRLMKKKARTGRSEAS